MKDDLINSVLHRVLMFGMLLSLGTMSLGLALYIADGSGDDAVIPIETLIDELMTGTPLAIVQLGILMLIATPFVRILAALIVFSIERDRQFVLISLIVLAMVLVAMVVKV
ncbi:MAG: DUF1634 domain-containing protein [Euryarchaeota archaeon]|nr:DUF1634 domain-containing protein [Euryarchaeota archaeon]